MIKITREWVANNTRTTAAALQLIDMLAQRGSYFGNELTQVGQIRDALYVLAQEMQETNEELEKAYNESIAAKVEAERKAAESQHL